MTSKKSATGTRLLGGLASIILVCVILAALNIIAGNLRLRKDMTEEKLYSLSDGTRQILGNLESDINLKFFFNSSSREMPPFLKDFAGRIEDLLAEYSLASHGRITIEKYDPQPDSDDEDTALRYGIAGQPMGMVGPSLYLGLAAVSGDTEATIPLIDPRTENLVEYNITRLIYRLANPERPKVGVLSTLPVLGSSTPQFMSPQGKITQKPWASFQEIRKNNELVEVPLNSTSIDRDLATLILVHPKGLSDATLLAIDQFVLRGGKLLALLDPFSITEIENSQAMSLGQAPPPSDISKLLTAWDVKSDPSKVVADMAAATRVNAGNGQAQGNPMWMLFRANSINQDDILTSGLEQLMLPFAGVFSAHSTDSVTVTPLITTSTDSSEVSTMTAQLGPQMLKREFKSTGVGLHPAIRVTGKFRTAFPQGINIPAPPSENSETTPAPQKIMPGLTEGESTVILIGDTDMFADRFCLQEMNFLGFQGFQPINDNVSLLANIVEQLSGSPELIGIRSRGKFERPFTRVLAMEQKARQKWQASEDELTQKLQAAQKRMNDLQAQKDPQQKLIMSPAQKVAIANFQKEEATIKKQLKAVRKSLRKEIDELGLMLKVINIGLIPLLVGLIGIAYGIMRKTAR